MNQPPLQASGPKPLLLVDGLEKYLPARSGAVVKAVDGVSFALPRNEIVGLVGESGSGNTTIGRCVLRLIEPTGGKVLFDGADVRSLGHREMLGLRRMQIVFQDPFSSLNPRMTVQAILGEAIDTHKLAKGAAKRERIGIARALAVEPEFVVADEPASALDVSVQAQVLILLQELRQTLGLSMLFISHDLAVVEYLCDEMVVLYLGKVMERGPSRTIYARPRHPYTRALRALVACIRDAELNGPSTAVATA